MPAGCGRICSPSRAFAGFFVTLSSCPQSLGHPNQSDCSDGHDRRLFEPKGGHQ
jgi:hypothetical protein